MESLEKIKISVIKVGEHEQRESIDDEEFNELCKSIGRVGLLSPIILAYDGDDYTLVAGHRRLAACSRLGFYEIDSLVRESDKPVDAEITFAENFHRKNLSPIEQAAAIDDCYKTGTMKISEIAKVFHRSENWVSAQIGMTSWPADILEAIHLGVLSVAAASNLAVIDDESYRAFLLRNAAEGGATARTTSAWLQAYRNSKPPEAALEEPIGPAGETVTPMVPQAPCLCCSQVYRTDQLSHVPICQGCIQAIRNT